MTLQKNLVTFLIPAFFIFSCHNDRPVKPGGTTVTSHGTDVYTSGTSNYNGHTVATYWKNGKAILLTKDTLSSGIGIALIGKDIYLSGYRQTGASQTVACYWKNGIEHDLADSTVYSYSQYIAANGNDIYIAGTTTLSSGLLAPTVWKNGVASVLPSNNIAASVSPILVNGSDVYTAGILRISPQQIAAVYWKNSTEVSLASSTFRISTLEGITVNDTNVYVVGVGVNNTLTITSPVFWKNGVPTILTPDSGAIQGQALAIAFHGSDMYIAGFSINGSEHEATLWKNGVPAALSGSSTTATANAIAINGNDIYVSGQDAAGSPAYWKNGKLVELPQQAGNANTATGILVVSY